MINFATFFQDRPRIVSWAVIILAADAVWGTLHSISSQYFSVYTIAFGLIFPLYFIHQIADGKMTARINYLIYMGVFALLGLILFTSLLPLVNMLSAYSNPEMPGFARFLLGLAGLLLALAPKIAAYLMLYSKESNKWFDQGAVALGAKPITSLNDTIEKH